MLCCCQHRSAWIIVIQCLQLLRKDAWKGNSRVKWDFWFWLFETLIFVVVVPVHLPTSDVGGSPFPPVGSPSYSRKNGTHQEVRQQQLLMTLWAFVSVCRKLAFSTLQPSGSKSGFLAVEQAMLPAKALCGH